VSTVGLDRPTSFAWKKSGVSKQNPMSKKSRRPKPITRKAIYIFRKMRRLEQRCECLPLEERIKPQRIKTPGWSVNQCPACTEWWKQNAALNKELGVLSFPVYEPPDVERDYKPQQSAVRRYYELVGASETLKRKQKNERRGSMRNA
jgi:hypothetical protein